jgi:Domain of unknown function (DUF4158)
MPVEFLTDDEAAAYDLYAGTPSQADLDRVFFLDDDDLKLVGKHRGEHMRAGFSLQLVTVRWLGKFLEDPRVFAVQGEAGRHDAGSHRPRAIPWIEPGDLPTRPAASRVHHVPSPGPLGSGPA